MTDRLGIALLTTRDCRLRRFVKATERPAALRLSDGCGLHREQHYAAAAAPAAALSLCLSIQLVQLAFISSSFASRHRCCSTAASQLLPRPSFDASLTPASSRWMIVTCICCWLISTGEMEWNEKKKSQLFRSFITITIQVRIN